MPLEVEHATYAKHLSALLPQSGKYVVIGGQRIVGAYDTYDDAITVGYDTFGLTPFLVKQIGLVEPIHRFTRDFGPTCAPDGTPAVRE